MTHSQKAVTYDSLTNKPIDCLFCRIQQRKEAGNIVYEDDEFVTFTTISPASSGPHLLVTPREHIQNLDSLSGPQDAEFVERMIAIAVTSLDSIDPTGSYSKTAQYSFHVPPW